jgi:hypothetical protein
MCAAVPSGPVPTAPPMNPKSRMGVVEDGRTYYADKAYVSFQELAAWLLCSGRGDGTTQVGTYHTGDIMEFESSELFSLRYPNLGTQYPFNFADLNEPVPRSAYMGLANCYSQQCETVGTFSYNPILAIPSKVRALDPLWSNCAFNFEGILDPPHALLSASLLTSDPNTDTAAQATSTAGGDPQHGTTKGGVQQGNTPTVTAAPEHRQTPQPDPTNPPAAKPPVTGVAETLINPIASAIMKGIGNIQNSADPQEPSDPQTPTPLDPTATIGGQVISSNPSGSGAVVGGSTLTPGGAAATLAGTVFSFGAGGLVVSTPGAQAQTFAFQTPAPPVFAPFMSVITSGPGGQKVVLGSQTLSAGGPAMTNFGVVYSVGSSGLVVSTIGHNGPASTYAFSSILGGAKLGVLTLTAGGHTITATPLLGAPPGSAIIIDGTTLRVGGPPATIAGTVLSLGPSGLVVGGTTTLAVSGTRSSVSTTSSKETSSTKTTSSTKETSTTSASRPSAAIATTKQGVGSRYCDFGSMMVIWIGLVIGLLLV